MLSLQYPLQSIAVPTELPLGEDIAATTAREDLPQPQNHAGMGARRAQLSWSLGEQG